jgi:hypothetical protein
MPMNRRQEIIDALERGIDIVSAMTESDLDREGRHAFHGHGKLERFIRWAYEHAQIHEDEIRAALKTKAKGEDP